MPDKIFFKCNTCDDVHYGLIGPELCPTCGNLNAYVQIEERMAREIMKF